MLQIYYFFFKAELILSKKSEKSFFLQKKWLKLVRMKIIY